MLHHRLTGWSGGSEKRGKELEWKEKKSEEEQACGWGKKRRRRGIDEIKEMDRMKVKEEIGHRILSFRPSACNHQQLSGKRSRENSGRHRQWDLVSGRRKLEQNEKKERKEWRNTERSRGQQYFSAPVNKKRNGEWNQSTHIQGDTKERRGIAMRDR